MDRRIALALVLLCGCGAARRLPGPLEGVRQLVVGTADGWDARQAVVRRYQRIAGGWQEVGAPLPAVLGAAGLAWGRGLHGEGAPAGRAGPRKAEGDGRSPAGAFRVLRAFGYAGAPPAGAALPYQALDEAWRCVDDPASARYNRVVDARTVANDWASAETMRRADELYLWVIELEHNGGTPVPGRGSCIFFHVRGGSAEATRGCTALARDDLETLLAWLKPGAVYVLLPRGERDALAAEWGLPQGH